MKPKKTLAVATYEERALIMQKKAAAQEFKFAAKKIAEAQASCKDLAKANVNSANKCREAGISIQALCGHNQISLEFWQKYECARKLKIGFETAKWLVQIANKCPDKITALDQAAPVIIQIYFAAELLEPPTREGDQSPVPVGFFQRALNHVTVIRGLFEKTWREVPIEKMKPAQLDDFLKTTEWLSIAREKAMRLRGEEFRKG